MDSKGFFASLFDFSISELITPKVIRFVYALLVILSSIFSLIMFITLLFQGGWSILVALIAVPITYLLWLIYFRVVVELIVVFFSINSEIKEIKAKQYSS